ncbi:hypothetical protein L596_001129 [Steinernema carpocapsae]|uniref:Uncharacterized protein n=1 Tax=Steinernema carpocapsae TaxID=34508 RepID=A0A4U8UKW8_STECR|nr:hypothetical protein L596_001129 [Steinernema carpocapsae]
MTRPKKLKKNKNAAYPNVNPSTRKARVRRLPKIAMRAMSIEEALEIMASYVGCYNDLLAATRTFVDHFFKDSMGADKTDIIVTTTEETQRKRRNAQSWTANVMCEFPDFTKWDLAGITVIEELPPHVAHLWKTIFPKIQKVVPGSKFHFYPTFK